MASLSTCHLGLWLGWQILLNLVKYALAFSLVQHWATRLVIHTSGAHLIKTQAHNMANLLTEL